MLYTEQEYLEICREFFDFLLKYTRRYKQDHPETPYSEILGNRSIMSFIIRTGSSELRDFPEEVCDFLKEADLDFEKAGEKYKKIIPELASKNAETAFAQNPKFIPGMSLRWDPPRNDVPPNWCVFHMWNALKPESFLRYPEYVAENFMIIMHESRLAYPQLDTLYTGSWLLSEPKFLRFFPEEFHRNLEITTPEIFWDQGFHGQFINARGTLNRRNAELFLKTGKLPFQHRKSHCSYESMKKHLLKNFLQQENVL